MITEKDITILSHLRGNARKKVTCISREIEMPVTTIYDRIRAHEKKGIVKKHTSILDFSKLGYQTRALVSLSIRSEKAEEFQKYLLNHPNVNSLYKVDLGNDFIMEVVFEDFGRLNEFINKTESLFCIDHTKTFNILQELKKEGFLSNCGIEN